MKKHKSNISSPEELNKHLQKNSPMTWIVLFLVIAILLGFFVWSFLFKMKIKLTGKATVQDHVVTLHVKDTDLSKLAVGQTVYILDQEGKILSFNDDKQPVVSSFNLEDNEYTYKVFIGEKRPIEFLIGK